jgi:hypothetical protein
MVGAAPGAVALAMLVVLALEHSEGGGSGGSTETGLGEMHRFVLLAVLKPQQLVSSERRGSQPHDKINPFAKGNVFGQGFKYVWVWLRMGLFGVGVVAVLVVHHVRKVGWLTFQ